MSLKPLHKYFYRLMKSCKKDLAANQRYKNSAHYEDIDAKKKKKKEVTKNLLMEAAGTQTSSFIGTFPNKTSNKEPQNLQRNVGVFAPVAQIVRPVKYVSVFAGDISPQLVNNCLSHVSWNYW